jgi:SAM-dependent methyltransferase
MVTVDQERARSFGTVAAEYDRVRPGYPAEMVTDVLAYAGLAPGVRALEVGAGTGKATLAFAERGVPVTAVEPDVEMAKVLRRNTSGHDVEVRIGLFEDFRDGASYGLINCGSAWHWVDPAVRWDLAARALVPGGAIALFWNRDHPSDPAVTDELRAAHALHAPDAWRDPEPATDADRLWPEMSDFPLYTDFTAEIYRWRRPMATSDYIANLGTLSRHIVQPPQEREALFADISRRLGETIDLAMDTVLYLARRR